jgi:ParB family chromosome partitioning protein
VSVILGRGLSDLLGPEAEKNTPLKHIPLQNLVPNPFQPRRIFDKESLAELATSIKENGLLQPILVRPDPEKPGIYQIIAGERRWRAAMNAKLENIPALVCTLDDKQSLEYALLENVQRENLNCIDEAEAYARLIAEFGHTQKHLSQIIGKSRSHIANLLRLLGLPNSVKEHVRFGRLSFGHARSLVGLLDAEILAEKIIAEGLTVRQAEAKTKHSSENMRIDQEALSEATLLAEQLTHTFGMYVRVNLRHEGGNIQIYFRDLQGLERLIERFG